MIAIILGTKTIPREEKSDLHIVELSNNDTVFVTKEELSKYTFGSTVMVNTKKYKKDGQWKTTKTLFKIKLEE